MGPNQQLHLILTNPQELETALREGWPLAAEIVNAVRSRDYQVFHEDEVGQRILALLKLRPNKRVGLRTGADP
jgi:hypothetical protein